MWYYNHCFFAKSPYSLKMNSYHFVKLCRSYGSNDFTCSKDKTYILTQLPLVIDGDPAIGKTLFPNNWWIRPSLSHPVVPGTLYQTKYLITKWRDSKIVIIIIIIFPQFWIRRNNKGIFQTLFQSNQCNMLTVYLIKVVISTGGLILVLSWNDLRWCKVCLVE